jgi:hypothetical protein
MIPAATKTLSLNTSSNSTISNIWGSSSLSSFGFGRFVGLAKDGWKVYDSTSGLPAALKLADQKTFEAFGFGVGAKYNVSTRAGLNVDIRGTAGSAALNLKDQVNLSWTQDATNFHLSSAYNYQPSQLRVSGPNASNTIKGIGDLDGKVDVIGKVPFGIPRPFSPDLSPTPIPSSAKHLDQPPVLLVHSSTMQQPFPTKASI